MEHNYKTNYNVLDSNKSYFYVIAINCCLSFVVFFVMSLVAKILGVSYQSLSAEQWYIYLTIIITPVAYLTLYLIYHKRTKIEIFKRLSKFNVLYALLAVALGAVCLFAVAPITNWLSYLLQSAGVRMDADLTFKMNNWWSIVLGIVGYALLPAVAEELIYRKVILNGYLSRYTIFGSVLITTLMFTFMHGSIRQFIYQLVLGAVLTALAVVTKKVIYPIIMHFTNNCLVVVLSITGGEYLVSGMAMPVSIGWNIALYAIIAVIAIVLMFGVLYYIYRHHTNALNDNDTNIIVSNKFSLRGFVKSQSQQEQLYLIAGVVTALIIWITNTISYF